MAEEFKGKGVKLWNGPAVLNANLSTVEQYDDNVFLEQSSAKNSWINITTPEILLTVPMGPEQRHQASEVGRRPGQFIPAQKTGPLRLLRAVPVERLGQRMRCLVQGGLAAGERGCDGLAQRGAIEIETPGEKPQVG